MRIICLHYCLKFWVGFPYCDSFTTMTEDLGISYLKLYKNNHRLIK